MLRLAVVIFILSGTVFAGVLVVATLLTPSLANVPTAIPSAAGLGALVAIPFAYLVARMIVKSA